MADLMGLLQNAGGEISLRGALGRFLQALALQTSESSERAIGYAKRITSDQTITSGQNVAFNSGNTRGNIQFVSASGSFILEANKRYLLAVGGRLTNFTDDATGSLDFKFVDDDNNVLNWTTLDCPALTFSPQTGTNAQSSGAALVFPYETGSSASSRTIKVRCTATQGGGSADVPANRFWVSVQEIGEAA